MIWIYVQTKYMSKTGMLFGRNLSWTVNQQSHIQRWHLEPRSMTNILNFNILHLIMCCTDGTFSKNVHDKMICNISEKIYATTYTAFLWDSWPEFSAPLLVDFRKMILTTLFSQYIFVDVFGTHVDVFCTTCRIDIFGQKLPLYYQHAQ